MEAQMIANNLFDVVSIPQAVGTIAINLFTKTELAVVLNVSIPQAVGTIAIY